MNKKYYKIQKLSLGTAQFGFNYGITNKKGKVSEDEVLKILNFCKQKNILSLDTASGYGVSEKIIGKTKINKFKIVTKIPKIPKNISTLEDWVFEKIYSSLKFLNLNKIYAILFHSPADLFTKKGNKIFKILQYLKKKKIIKKIGVSVYNRTELVNIIKNYDIDIVNLPLSIANRDFLKNNFLKKIKAKNIEIHIRSIFLQGLLLNYNHIKFKYLMKTNFFQKWNSWLNNNKISALDACVCFVKNIKEVDKIVVGVDDLKQLKLIYNSFNKKKYFIWPNFEGSKKLVNPQKWKLNEKKIY